MASVTCGWGVGNGGREPTRPDGVPEPPQVVHKRPHEIIRSSHEPG